MSVNTSSGKITTTSQAPSVNFAIAKIATTTVEMMPADKLIAILCRQPGSRWVR